MIVGCVAIVAVLSACLGGRVHLYNLSKMANQTLEAHPNALWHVVHGLCVTNARASGRPEPCVEVNLQGGYAIVKNFRGATHYLLVPTDRLIGIESPKLQRPGGVNYWQAAWGARHYIAGGRGLALPREDIGMAVNSAYARTQDQLHIHIDCVRRDVRAALFAHQSEIGSRWTRLNFGLPHRRYMARWVDRADLGVDDPFKMLALDDPTARADMARETLAVIGATRPDGTPGFVVLSDRAHATDNAAGESLLDHKCAFLKENFYYREGAALPPSR
jgi:CDP-diacylglycerol pyrophosphatase